MEIISKMLNVQKAAAYCALSKATLSRLREAGGGPPYSKIGTRVIYCIDDLDAWLASKRRMTISDTGV